MEGGDGKRHLGTLVEAPLDHRRHDGPDGNTQHLNLLSGWGELKVLDELNNGGLHLSETKKNVSP